MLFETNVLLTVCSVEPSEKKVYICVISSIQQKGHSVSLSMINKNIKKHLLSLLQPSNITSKTIYYHI